mmetsp:Transcript_8441/g.8353  ORF Transcript_8441/g.8353 Transcript_8441/m.8353 type:complete len:400 (+) Transcript_8441:108-1307(+)
MLALKVIRPDRLTTMETELDVLQNVSNHPNIIKLLDYSKSAVYHKKQERTKFVSYIALELAKNGEIFDFVFKLGAFPEPIARFYFKCLLSAVEALHSAGVVHRDLKPENIFLTENFELKLSDFGYAGPTSGRDGSGQLNTFKGTRPYMAPEILERKPYRGISTDLFSCGIILFIFMLGRPPFARAERQNPHFVHIFTKNWERFWKVHKSPPGTPEIPEEFQNFIEKMLCYNPEERMSAEEIKNHQWFQGPTATLEEAKAFLAPAIQNTESAEFSSEGESSLGYRSFSDPETNLLRQTSRRVVSIDQSLLKITKFFSNIHPDDLFQAIKYFFELKNGNVKIDPINYEMKARFVYNEQAIEVNAFMMLQNEKLLVGLSKISGYHWDYYDIYRELFQEVVKL